MTRGYLGGGTECGDVDDADREEYPTCNRCGADTEWVDCESCSDGLDGHDCGEDTCCCKFPEDNVVCQFCDGNGGWILCVARCSEPKAVSK